MIPVRCIDSHFSLPSPSSSLSLSLLSFLPLRNYFNSKSVFHKKLSLILHLFLFLSDASFQFVKTHLRGHSSNFCHVKAMLFSSVGLAPHLALEAKTADFLFLLNNETQIGINSQKCSEYFCTLFRPGQIKTKSAALLLPVVISHFAQSTLFSPAYFEGKKANAALIKAVMQVQRSEDCRDGSATLSFYINLQCICQRK